MSGKHPYDPASIPPLGGALPEVERDESIDYATPAEWDAARAKLYVGIGDLAAEVELDPNGMSPHAPGAKLDSGKSPVVRGCLQYFPLALKQVALLSEFGANKYAWKGWESVPDGIARYSDALGRHLLDEAHGPYDDNPGGSGFLEATAVAWNALARLELMLRDPELVTRVEPKTE